MNITKITPLNFKGVYLSNNLSLGEQSILGKEVQNLLNSSGLADSYEKENKDILIEKGPRGGINIVLAEHTVKRLVDDNYSRWHGRF